MTNVISRLMKWESEGIKRRWSIESIAKPHGVLIKLVDDVRGLNRILLIHEIEQARFDAMDRVVDRQIEILKYSK